MRWWPFGKRGPEPVAPGRSRRTVSFSLDAPSEITGLPAQMGIAPRISRREALQVPAVLRARNLICGSLGSLPVRVHAPDRRVVTDVSYLVPQPDPDIATSVVMAQTIEDLLFEGVAWWHVIEWGWHGYPTKARKMPFTSVHVDGGGSQRSEMLISPDQLYPVDGQVYFDGVAVLDHEVIRFDSPNPPLLEHAARAIRTCLLLDQAAALYAKDPLPLGYFAPRDPNSDPASTADIGEILDSWEEARSQRAWGYVNAALEAKALSWNPEQLQLAAQRQHAVLEIARATCVDPEDLGVSTTSRTYANSEQRRQDLIDFTLGPYVAAVQDRLAMRDVLPRGYTARIDFAGFLRGDEKTRMETYKIGREVGAYTEEEIRDRESRPPLTRAQRAAASPPAPVTPAPPAPAGEPEPESVKAGRGDMYQFTGDDLATRVSFDGAELAATFRVDAEKRTVSGLAVPWGKVARSGYNKWKFPEGSLHWSGEARVKMNLDHDHGQTVGVGRRLQSVAAGLDTTFKVARGPEGDRALTLADDGVYDGFSIEIDFDSDGDGWQPDPADESVRLVNRATLRAVALTAMPSFDDARVTRVAASRNGAPVTSPTTADVAAAAAGTTPPAPVVTFTAEQFDALATKQGEAFSAAITAVFEKMQLPQHGGPGAPVPAGRVQVTREEPVYTFSGGGGPSLVRDAWHARVEGNADARERLAKFGRQQTDMVRLVERNPHIAAQFATVSTGTAAAVIPPGYRPDLYVTQLLQGRPFVDSFSRGALTDATPFVIPKFVSAVGGAADHVQGTNPTDGTLTVNTVTVTPSGVSGKFVLTREIIDSANPAIDQIAFTAMREAYSQNTEAKAYAELNGANGQGGVITAGFVPSGAQVAVTTGGSIAGGTFGGAELLAGVRGAMALYPFRRFGAPNRMHLSQESTSAFASATGTDGRPLLPRLGPTNTVGTSNPVQGAYDVDGLPGQPTWAMTGNAAGDADVLAYNNLDVWAWESPLLTFRFEEKSGPANIELALFGYFATRLLRPVGLTAIRHTRAA